MGERVSGESRTNTRKPIRESREAHLVFAVEVFLLCPGKRYNRNGRWFQFQDCEFRNNRSIW